MDQQTKQKIVNALSGSQTGAIVACALGVETTGPRFTSKAIVTSDGFVQANFVDRNDIARHSALVGSYEELKQNLRGAISFLKAPSVIGLTDDQAHELFNAVAFDWIVTDYRRAA